MKQYALTSLTLAVVLLLCHPAAVQAQRPGGGARGGFGGGASSGGGRSYGGGVVGPYGGGAYQGQRSAPVVGPAGGIRQGGSGSGSYTTNRGTSINYKGAGVGVAGPGGGVAGRGVGGVQVTTPGGQTATKVGKVGGAIGPGGNAVGNKSSLGYTTGPAGTGFSSYKGGVALGPQGGVAGSSKTVAGTGPGGNAVAGRSRSAVAVGPHGIVAGGSKVVAGTGPGGSFVAGKSTVAGANRYGTYYASSRALATQGAVVRQNFVYRNAFTPRWYAQYPGTWFVAGWTAARIWTAPSWTTVSTYCSYPVAPVYYDYGTTVVVQANTVYVNGEAAGTTEKYYQQAEQLAVVGQQAKVSDQADQWQPLGVFALVQGEEKTSYNVFQLAINKQGILRGNYYNAMTDVTEPIQGSVDKKTQRAAWTVGKNKKLVYEAGAANLTKDETTVLVHFGQERSQQFVLVRVEQPQENAIQKN